jgi:hypothetical protein
MLYEVYTITTLLCAIFGDKVSGGGSKVERRLMRGLEEGIGLMCFAL